MMTTDETIGQRIRRIRLERGLSQERLAAMTGLSASGISRIESGQRHPLPRTIRDIAHALGVTIEELVRVEGE